MLDVMLARFIARQDNEASRQNSALTAAWRGGGGGDEARDLVGRRGRCGRRGRAKVCSRRRRRWPVISDPQTTSITLTRSFTSFHVQVAPLPTALGELHQFNDLGCVHTYILKAH